MRKSLLIFAAILISVTAFAQEGKRKIETRNISAFDKIRVSKGINVTLIEGEKPKAEVHIQNADLSDVITESEKNTLTLKMKTKIYKDVAVQVFVTYQTLRDISVGAGGSVDGKTTLFADQLTMDAGMDGSIDLDIDVNVLEASVSAARITLAGNANTLEIKATTGGKFEGKKLESKKAYVKANTGGVATVWASESIDASAGTGGTVEYGGDPTKVETKETLGGTIKKL